MKRIFDAMLPELTVDDLTYIKKVCVGLLDECEEISPPTTFLLCEEKMEAEHPEKENIVETEFITGGMKKMLDISQLINSKDLNESAAKLGVKPFSKDFLMSAAVILHEQGFTPTKFVHVSFSEERYIITFKGHCNIHGYMHHSNNCAWIWDPKYRNSSIIKCHHDGKTKKLDFPMNI